MLLAEPFLDISGRSPPASEQGLLGLAFHPRVRHERPVRGPLYRSRRRHPGVRVPGIRRSRRGRCRQRGPILAEDQPFPNHNGGQMLFGPDGYLYISLGDGGSADDPGGRGQSLADLLGSILQSRAARRRRVRRPARQPVRRDRRRPSGDLELRAPESLAVRVRSGHRRSLHRRRRPEPVGRGRCLDRGRGRGAGTQLRLEHRWRAGSASRMTPAIRTRLELPVLSYDHGDRLLDHRRLRLPRRSDPGAAGALFLLATSAGGWVRSFRLEDGSVVDEFQWPTLRAGRGRPELRAGRRGRAVRA